MNPRSIAPFSAHLSSEIMASPCIPSPVSPKTALLDKRLVSDEVKEFRSRYQEVPYSFDRAYGRSRPPWEPISGREKSGLGDGREPAQT